MKINSHKEHLGNEMKASRALDFRCRCAPRFFLGMIVTALNLCLHMSYQNCFEFFT